MIDVWLVLSRFERNYGPHPAFFDGSFRQALVKGEREAKLVVPQPRSAVRFRGAAWRVAAAPLSRFGAAAPLAEGHFSSCRDWWVQHSRSARDEVKRSAETKSGKVLCLW